MQTGIVMASTSTNDCSIITGDITGHVLVMPKDGVSKRPTDNGGKVPNTETSHHKRGRDRVPERPAQAICSDILFLENVISYIKDIGETNESIKTVIIKLRELVRKKIRSLNTSGSGTCLEDSVELLHSKVTVLQRTVMDKYWAEFQDLGMGPNGRSDEHPGTQRNAYRRSSRFDDSSYSPADSRTSRRDSFEDELSSRIDRLDHFITNKYKDDFREVRKNAMPRLHRRQSLGKTPAEHSLAERILRSRKNNRNEYNTPRGVSDSRPMISPDSTYSRVSAGSSSKGNDVIHRSPPDGNSYHEEILDIVASFNDKTKHVNHNGSVPIKPKPVEPDWKQYRPNQHIQTSIQTKANVRVRRGSNDYPHPDTGFPQVEQPHSCRESTNPPHRAIQQPQATRSVVQPHSYRESTNPPHRAIQQPQATRSVVRKSVATKSVGTQSVIKTTPRTITEKKKRKKPRPTSPRTDRTSWMKTVTYDQGHAGKTCSCDRHNKQEGGSMRRTTDEPKRWEGAPRYTGHRSPLDVSSGDIPRPRVNGVMETAREKESGYELTAIHDHQRRFDHRPQVVNRRRQPSPHNGEKIFDYGIMKEKRFSPLYDEDYIRQYRSLQL